MSTTQPVQATLRLSATALDIQLAALVNQWRVRPFQWGVTDCCQFARAAALMLHGVATPSPLYGTEREAFRAVAALGGYPGILKAAGFVRRPVQAARRGDFVVVLHAAGLFEAGLAVVTGAQAHTTTRVGLLAVPRSVWQECWGVA